MSEKKNDSWFEYSLLDAWGLPLLWASIQKDEEKTECRTLLRQVGDDAFYPDRIEIDSKSLQEIIRILEDDRIYSIKEIENPFCLDGFIQKFCFTDGSRKVELLGFNMDQCEGKKEEYPNANIVLEVFGKIREILIPLGVAEERLSLTPKWND